MYDVQLYMYYVPYSAAHSRADHDHQAVAKGSNSNQEIGQRQPELQEANCPLAVVIAIEKYRIFTVTLKEKKYDFLLKNCLIGVLNSKSS